MAKKIEYEKYSSLLLILMLHISIVNICRIAMEHTVCRHLWMTQHRQWSCTEVNQVDYSHLPCSSQIRSTTLWIQMRESLRWNKVCYF